MRKTQSSLTFVKTRDKRYWDGPKDYDSEEGCLEPKNCNTESLKKYICVDKNFKWYFVKIQCFEYFRMWLYFYLPHYLGSLHCRKLLYNNLMLRRSWSKMERKIQWFAELCLALKNNPLVQVQTKQIRMACWTTQAWKK